MAKRKFIPITIAAAEKLKDESRLFVLNRADGNINFNITDTAGERKVITLPLTFCPVDLSNFAERPSILRNSDFRRLVAKQAIVLVDNDDAADFITNDPTGRSETNRIYDVIVEGHDPVLGFNENATDTELAERMGLQYHDPFIHNLVLRSSSEEDGADLISEIESRSHMLKPEDLAYVANHSKNPDLKAWAASEVEELRLEEETRPDGGKSAGV